MSPPPFGSGAGTLVCGRGSGGVSIPTRGHRLWYSIYCKYVIYDLTTLCSCLEISSNPHFPRQPANGHNSQHPFSSLSISTLCIAHGSSGYIRRWGWGGGGAKGLWKKSCDGNKQNIFWLSHPKIIPPPPRPNLLVHGVFFKACPKIPCSLYLVFIKCGILYTLLSLVRYLIPNQ